VSNDGFVASEASRSNDSEFPFEPQAVIDKSATTENHVPWRMRGSFR